MELSQRREKLLKRLSASRTRAREGRVLVEGVRAVEEVLGTTAVVDFAVVSPKLAMTEGGRRILQRLSGEGMAGGGSPAVEVVDVDDASLPGLAGTENPQGVLLVCGEPAWTLDDLPEAGPLVVLDAIQDPGNVGTLIRSAAAFGFRAVIALDGTGDPWGAKTVRASSGTVFRIPVGRAGCEDTMAALVSGGWRILAAAADGTILGATPEVSTEEGVSTGAERRKKVALVLGNEGAGVRDDVRRAAHETIAIRMSADVESLNVGIAGSILMHELTRGDG